ncbi:hypothetical protein BCR33DRAFT_371171 [Rhizoclosmatium globosum]|uniref:Rho-GAP domain-containing protein n=1 Tax=Rhizoclosmatium globosum TaxID=329046 RepID=A0A1Y2BZG5_9FUNG|nr:hypothetical protein BCR33DRAFT_371171 [Rhizoclosmatium globosum]|eukprot:ORY40160.1 hypothetical protein BCR33DRAFT_371171 [Rhizoclosmatium globosum]
MDAIALECGSNLPSQELWSRVKRTFEDHFRSRQHLHTVAYFLLHLQRVASYSKTNKMTAKNLATCVFITAKEGGEFVINHADFIFGNIDFIGQETVSFLPFSETRNVAHICQLGI